MFAVAVFIFLAGFPGPVVVTVEARGVEELRFATLDSCMRHIALHRRQLELWSYKLEFPTTGLTVKSASLTCVQTLPRDEI